MDTFQPETTSFARPHDPGYTAAVIVGFSCIPSTIDFMDPSHAAQPGIILYEYLSAGYRVVNIFVLGTLLELIHAFDKNPQA